jgi:hypothetical protein
MGLFKYTLELETDNVVLRNLTNAQLLSLGTDNSCKQTAHDLKCHVKIHKQQHTLYLNEQSDRSTSRNAATC